VPKPTDRHPFIYIASPFGFSEAGRLFYANKLLPLLKTKGTTLDPWAAPDLSSPPLPTEDLHVVNFRLGKQNAKMIRQADIVFACLDGGELDSGTASEVGFAYGLGKKIIGYRSDFRLCGDNASATVNLQVQYFIEASGGGIYSTLSDAIAALDDLFPIFS
jgi:nucleoside 2-deoxyribosyltransferase